MKANQFVAAIALGGLLGLGGSALAADNPHAAYDHAFYGTRLSAMEGHATTPAATRAFMAPRGGIQVLTTTGLASWSPPAEAMAGKAAFGTPAHDTANGLKTYHRVFIGD